MRLLTRLVALLLCPLLLACPSPEERSEQAREDARLALARGDQRAALHAIETLRTQEPETPEDLIALGSLQVAAGEAPAALRLFERGLERWPERDDLRLGQAQVALLLSDANSARAVLLGVKPESEHHAAALVLRSQADLKLGDFERAVRTLAEAERLYPDRPEARIARIGALLGEQRIDEAREALASAREPLIAAGQQDALLGFELGLLGAQVEDDPEAAVAGLRELAESHPEDPRVWGALVNSVISSGKAQEAVTLLTDAIEENPDRLFLYTPLASLYRSSDQPEESVAVLRELIERSPSPSAYIELAQHYVGQPDAAESVLQSLEEGLSHYPDDALLRRADAEAKLVFGALGAAREAVRTYRDRFPDDPSSEYLRARLELAEGKTGVAIQRLTELMPRLDQAFTQHWLGQALEASGNLEGAERRYALAVQRDSSDPTLYLPLVRLAAQRGAWREVSQLGEILVRLEPRRPEGWSAWQRGLTQLGDGARAEPVARRYVELFPDREDAQLGLARALRGAARFDEALAALDAAEPGFEDKAHLEAERVLTLGLSGRLDEGIALARRAMAEHPGSAAVQLTAASLLFEAGHAEEGARAAERAFELDPADPQPLALRARFRASVGLLDGAREDCMRYLAERPDDSNIHFVLGSVQERSGRTDEAIAAYQRAAKLDAEAFAPRNNLAYLLADRDLDAALIAAQEAYALRSENPAVLDTLGWLYLRKGLAERATALLEEAHAGAPELAEIQLHLALAHRDTGHRDTAHAHLRALSERDDTSDDFQAQVREALRSLE